MKIAIAVLLLAPAVAHADVGRYAVLIGSNRGDASDRDLRFSIRDAQRLREVLMSVGQFRSDHITLLASPTSDRVQEVLAETNARIRAEQPAEGSSSLLLVFYSGHADALSLHLDGTRLPLGVLRDMTAGSSALTRVLIIDACRSGNTTRVKGTALEPPFEIPIGARPPEGFAIMSSASMDEIAQESDVLEGSFFSHHLISALLGTADANGDGLINLSEAFDYASDRTVASTATTLSGVQHPTYMFDIKGRSSLVLTRPGYPEGSLGTLVLDAPGDYLLRSNGPEGFLVLEAAIQRPRSLRLTPGSYFIQRRTTAQHYEGSAEVIAFTTSQVMNLKPVERTTLVQKGGRDLSMSAALWGGSSEASLRGYSPGWVLALSTSLSFGTAAMAIDGRLDFQRSEASHTILDGVLDHVGAQFGARKIFDLDPISLSIGLRFGAGYERQYFRTDRVARPRQLIIPSISGVFRAELPISGDIILALETQLSAFRLKTSDDVEDSQVQTPVLAGGFVGIGKSW